MDRFIVLFDLVGELARRRYQMAEQGFAGLGLNHTEARLLSLLHQKDGSATQDELSSMLFIDRSNAGRGLKRLETGGYVARSKDSADKRANLVQMTQKGRQAVAAISRIRKEMARSFFGNLTAQEAGLLADLLKKAQAG